MSRKVLVLTPHPDDAEFFAGGTIAKMAAGGTEVVIVIATDGDKGSFELDAAKLAQVRRMEALRAAGVLGVKELIFLGYHDGELDQLPPGKLREQFIRHIRQFRPEVLMTFDPFGLYETHPDHHIVAFAAAQAADFAAYPLYHPEHAAEGLEPHLVAEKYFFAKEPVGVNKVVDIAETLQAKIAAMLEHKSQVAFLVEEVRRQAALVGLDVSAFVPGGAAGEEGAALAMAWGLQEQARAAGAKAGVEFAEVFRYVRFSPVVEALLESRDAQD